MGHYGDYRTKTEIKDESLKWINRSDKLELLKYASTENGRCQWFAVKDKLKNESFICMNLIKGSHGNYVYKPMSEDMGPCYYSCPIELLELTPDYNKTDWAIEWRDKVKKHHNKKVGNYD